jgi:pimeloyl-ACP methyl ester carboxylesterase
MTRPISRRIPVASGLTLHALEWGAERADLEQSVFLIHGFLDLAWGWSELVSAGLSDSFHVVALDQRGHGDSDWIGAGGYYYFMDYVADLASVIAATGRSRVSLVGHSMGGTVASYYTGAFPDRVRRLALLEGVGPPEDSAPLPTRTQNWIQQVEAVRSKRQRTYESVEAAARRLQEHDARLKPDLALRLAQHGTRALADGRFVFKHDPLHLTRGPYPFRLDFARAFWDQIDCPVLLVEGAESPFRALADREQRASAFRNRRAHVIEGAAHMMQRHQPEALCRVLVDFLQ